MEHVSSVVYWKILGKSGNSKKVDPFSRLERSERNYISLSIYTFLVLYISSNCYQLGSHLGVLPGNGLGAVPEFTIKWNNFLPIGKSLFPHRNLIFRNCYLNGKRPKLYELIPAQSGSTSHEKIKCSSSTKQ